MKTNWAQWKGQYGSTLRPSTVITYRTDIFTLTSFLQTEVDVEVLIPFIFSRKFVGGSWFSRAASAEWTFILCLYPNRDPTFEKNLRKIISRDQCWPISTKENTVMNYNFWESPWTWGIFHLPKIPATHKWTIQYFKIPFMAR